MAKGDACPNNKEIEEMAVEGAMRVQDYVITAKVLPISFSSAALSLQLQVSNQSTADHGGNRNR